MAKKSTTPAAPRPRRVTTKPAVTAGNASAQDLKANAPAREPSADEIAQAAYQRYLSRGGQHGSDFDDWIEAERELTRQRSG